MPKCLCIPIFVVIGIEVDALQLHHLLANCNKFDRIKTFNEKICLRANFEVDETTF